MTRAKWTGLLLLAGWLLFAAGCGGMEVSSPAVSPESRLPDPSMPYSTALPAAREEMRELALTEADGTEQSYRLTEKSLQSDTMELSLTRLCGGAVLEAYREYRQETESFSYVVYWNGSCLTIPAEEHLVLQSVWGEETGLWAICVQGGELQHSTLLCRWNWEGERLYTEALTSLPDGDASACDLLLADGKLLLLTEGTLLRLNAALEPEGRLELPQHDIFGCLVPAGNGMVCCRQGGTLSIIDLENLTLGEQYNVPAIYTVWAGNGDYDLFLTSEKSLYGVNLSRSSAQELLLWADASLTQPDSFLGIAAAGYLLMQMNPFTLENELLTVEEIPPEQAVEKAEVVLAVTGEPEFNFTGSDTYAAIQYFNQRSSQYHLSVAYYYGESAAEQAAQIQQLKMDILTGTQIDLILMNGFDPYPFQARGLLEDLYPWIDQDPDLRREDLSPSLLTALEAENKLYFCAANYMVSGYVGLRQTVGDTRGWSLEEFAQAVRAVDTSEVTPISGLSGADFLDYYIRYNYGHFVDTESGTCDFDCEEFRLLLELCRDSFPAIAREGSIQEGTAILEKVQTVPIYTTFPEDLAAFGGDAVLAGFPGAGGNGGVLQQDYSSFSMLSTSRQKEGAWSFLKLLWSDIAQSKGIHCPALLRAMDKALSRQVTAYGNLTEAEAELTRDFYLGATAHAVNSTAIQSIVTEEAQALLAGDKSIDDTIAVIQNRAMIYLSEQS